MKQALSSFVTVLVAGVAIVVILALGMGFTIRRFERLSSSQIALVRLEEAEINAAARLRWSSELLVSVGRGYLLSGNPILLVRLHEVESSFDRDLAALRTAASTVTVSGLVDGVDRAARRFRFVQSALVAERMRSDIGNVIGRFDSELLPLRGAVERALDRLLVHKQAVIENVYKQAALDRGQVARRLYTLLAMLVCVGLAISWLVAKRLQESHRQEQEALYRARTALAARDQLMGVVAHDLRTPLSAITMTAALWRRTGADDSRQRARSVENIAVRMEYLIKSLLDMAAMEAGRFSIAPEPFDTEGVVRDTLDMFASTAAAKQIRLERTIGAPDLTVYGDRERVLQVLSNLFGNALKFTPQGGTVRLDVERKDGMAAFSVSDTGPGVSPESAPHVFERFWKGGQGQGERAWACSSQRGSSRRMAGESGSSATVRREPSSTSRYPSRRPRGRRRDPLCRRTAPRRPPERKAPWPTC